MQVVDWISRQAGKLADKFDNYKFYVKSTPDHVDSSTRLFLNTFTSRDEEAIVPCTYKWTRIKNGILADVPEFKGNTFLCEPSDVGSTIQAEVTSIDEQYPGTAILKYGPVQIDVLLKQTIESALSTGEAKFPVDIGHDDRTKQCSFMITDDFMRIAHCNSNAHFKFYYCLGEPLINALPKDPTNISIVFPQKYQNETIKFLSQLWTDMSLSKDFRSGEQLTVNIKFINRRSKDEFLFVMKGFIAKKELKNTTAIKKIQKLDIDDSNIHFMLEIQSLRKDLLRLFNLNKKAQQEKKVYMDETLKLQKEIEDIISSYTKLIQGKFRTKQEFEESFIDFENKKDNAISHKYQKIQQENARLKEYIRQKLDGEKDTYINHLKEQEGRVDYTSNAFSKKKEPFAQISGKKENQVEYEKVLDYLAVEEGGDQNATEMKEKNRILQEKLTKSILKIEKLEGELDKINRSGYMGVNDPNNLSMSRQSSSALDISTNKVVDEKVLLEKKYAKLKEDYAKLKNAYQTIKASNTSNPPVAENVPKPEDQSNEIIRIKSALAAMQREKDSWKEKAESLGSELRKEKEESQKSISRLEKRLNQMKMELEMNRKSTDALNRSQHLSAEMEEYNIQQLQILKEQNTFLMNQNERLTKMCQKYKTEYKKLKENFKVTEADSMLL